MSVIFVSPFFSMVTPIVEDTWVYSHLIGLD